MYKLHPEDTLGIYKKLEAGKANLFVDNVIKFLIFVCLPLIASFLFFSPASAYNYTYDVNGSIILEQDPLAYTITTINDRVSSYTTFNAHTLNDDVQFTYGVSGCDVVILPNSTASHLSGYCIKNVYYSATADKADVYVANSNYGSIIVDNTSSWNLGFTDATTIANQLYFYAFDDNVNDSSFLLGVVEQQYSSIPPPAYMSSNLYTRSLVNIDKSPYGYMIYGMTDNEWSSVDNLGNVYGYFNTPPLKIHQVEVSAGKILTFLEYNNINSTDMGIPVHVSYDDPVYGTVYGNSSASWDYLSTLSVIDQSSGGGSGGGTTTPPPSSFPSFYYGSMATMGLTYNAFLDLYTYTTEAFQNNNTGSGIIINGEFYNDGCYDYLNFKWDNLQSLQIDELTVSTQLLTFEDTGEFPFLENNLEIYVKCDEAEDYINGLTSPIDLSSWDLYGKTWIEGENYGDNIVFNVNRICSMTTDLWVFIVPTTCNISPDSTVLQYKIDFTGENTYLFASDVSTPPLIDYGANCPFDNETACLVYLEASSYLSKVIDGGKIFISSKVEQYFGIFFPFNFIDGQEVCYTVSDEEACNIVKFSEELSIFDYIMRFSLISSFFFFFFNVKNV